MTNLCKAVSTQLLVAGVRAATVGVTAGQALADPPSTPTLTGIVGVGSNTTQLVMDQLATDYNASHPTSPQVTSWDAVGSSPITEKTGCSPVTRPNGSNAGITALRPTRPPPAPATLTSTALKAIYSCDASILGTGFSGPVTWNVVGGTGTAAVVPVIPPAGSAIRGYFLSRIGVTTLGSCVKGTDNSVEQNEGTNPVFACTNATATADITKHGFLSGC